MRLLSNEQWAVVLAQLPDNNPLTPFRGMFANGLGAIAAHNHTATNAAVMCASSLCRSRGFTSVREHAETCMHVRNSAPTVIDGAGGTHPLSPKRFVMSTEYGNESHTSHHDVVGYGEPRSLLANRGYTQDEITLLVDFVGEGSAVSESGMVERTASGRRGAVSCL